MNTSDDFWADNLEVLIDSDRVVEFFPSDDMSTNEKLNAVTRAGIYIGLLFSIYKQDARYMIITLIVALTTLLVNTYKTETFD